MATQTGEYINFDERVVDSNTLRERFIDDMELFGNAGDNTCKLLKTLMDREKRSLRLNCWQTTNENPLLNECYLIMIKGSNDGLLIRLAKECNFPRGFPIIWIPNQYIRFYGFYPKFANDAKEEKPTDDKVFRGVKEIDFNFKYSGFLVQFVPFKLKGHLFWTMCSKNATSNEFAGSHVVT
jgi:hypothetical protein